MLKPFFKSKIQDFNSYNQFDLLTVEEPKSKYNDELIF